MLRPILAVFFIFGIFNAHAQWHPGDELVDERDGQVYKTVQIGEQCWMAENLNIGTMIESNAPGRQMSDNGMIEKYCWNNVTGNCDGSDGKIKRGGFYEWQEAIQYWNGQPELPVRGICPEGWHIPSNAEWNELLNYLGGNNAYTKMLEGGSSGFEARLTGYRCTMTGSFRVSAMTADTRTYFWTAEQADANNAPFIELGQQYLGSMAFNKSLGLCVRCVWNGQASGGPKIKLNMDKIDFGYVSPGNSSSKYIDIANEGDESLTIQTVSIRNDDQNVFSIVGEQGNITIEPGAAASLEIEFTPLSEGNYTAVLMIKSNDESNSEIAVTISGEAPSSVLEDAAGSRKVLIEIRPHPVITGSVIEFQLLQDSNFDVEVFAVDMFGNKVLEIFRGKPTPGRNIIELCLSGLNSGKYFLMFRHGPNTFMKEFMVIK